MKKLWVNIGIFFGCFLLLVTSLGAVLIIAPGMELLGLMYIRSTSGSVYAREIISDVAQFDHIYIESNNIPVRVEFIQSYSLRVELVDEYNGFAKAGETPTIKVSHHGDTIVVESNEYEPFIAHSRSDASGLIVKIPMYYTNNIMVVSQKSDVHFCGQTASVNDIVVNTGGDILFSNDLSMHSLNLNLKNNDAVISNSVVMSGHIVAKSKSGDLTVPAGFSGKLDFDSTSGDLFVGGCAGLNFNSKSGRIGGIGNVLPNITGDAFINTGGKVEIGYIGGAGIINAGNGKVIIGEDGKEFASRLEIFTKLGEIKMRGRFTNVENKINSKYGDIKIESMSNFCVETTYGDIEVSKIDTYGKIVTHSGDVDVDEVVGKVEIESKSGDVKIGEASKVLENAYIATKSGDIEVFNAGNGEIQIETKSGDIEFTQDTACKSKLTINAEKSNVYLSGITGETTVSTKGKIFATIHDLNHPVTLTGKNKAFEVHVRKVCYVDLESKKTIEAAPDLTEKTKTYNNTPETETEQVLKIRTARGKISVIKD